MSEAYENISSEPKLELKVVTLNINEGSNRELMEQCQICLLYTSFRCHQSYIISLYFVEKMDTGKFIVQSAEIPVSRKYQRAAREMYYDYMFEKM